MANKTPNKGMIKLIKQILQTPVICGISLYIYIYLFCHAIILVFHSSLLRSKPSKDAHSRPRKPNGNVTNFGCPHYQAYNCQELEPERPMCPFYQICSSWTTKTNAVIIPTKKPVTIVSSSGIVNHWFDLILSNHCWLHRFWNVFGVKESRHQRISWTNRPSPRWFNADLTKKSEEHSRRFPPFFADGQQKARKSNPLSQAGMCLIILRLRLTPVWLLQFFWVISPQHKAKGAIWIGRVALQWTSTPKESLLRICCAMTLDMSNSWNQKKPKLPDRVQGIRGRPRLVHDSQPQAQWQ